MDSHEHDSNDNETDLATRLGGAHELLASDLELTSEHLDEVQQSLSFVSSSLNEPGIAELAGDFEELLGALRVSDAPHEIRALLAQGLGELVSSLAILEAEESAEPSPDPEETSVEPQPIEENPADTVQADASPAEPEQANDDAQAAKAEAELSELLAELNHQISPELFSVYSEEAEDHMKSLYAGLSDLQNSPDDREKLQDIRRTAHTLKGAAGVVGLQLVSKLAHRMEDLLDHLYARRAPVEQGAINLLQETTDCLQDLSVDEYDPDDIRDRLRNNYVAYGKLLGVTSVEAEEETHEVEQSATVPAEVAPAPVAAATGTEPDAESESQKAGDRRKNDRTGHAIRVPLARIDDLVRVVGELIINRASFEQRMADLARCVEEMRPILTRLRAVSHEMETRYSIDALREYRGARLEGSPVPLEPAIGGTSSEFDALEFDRYNEFHLLARSVSEATGDVSTVTNELHSLFGDFDSLLERQDQLSRDTQDRLMQIRMVPLATLSTRLHRTVRVVANQLNKRVELIIEGEKVELDKTVLEEVTDPMMHLLRNAVDHGIETSRSEVGKPEQATIRLKAFYQGTQVVLRISDDGRGLNSDRILKAAINGGLLSRAEAESMTPQEIYPYIFVPGLSTAEGVSRISGRGVGMDVVVDRIEKLKGTIDIDSMPGRGTTFTIRLPMSLAVVRGLLVESGNASFAIPMQSVEKIIRRRADEVESIASKPLIREAGVAYPLMNLSDHLGQPLGEDFDALTILIVHAGDREIAVKIDRIIAARDIVVKTLGTHLRSVPGLVGATLLGDGTVVPILDPNTFLGATESTPKPAPVRRALANHKDRNVMIVDDSVSVRRVMENLARSQQWNPIVARDGAHALEILRSSEDVPDVFLLDVEMPRMDGFELLANLRGMPRFANKSVVMVTSRAGAKHRARAKSLGADEYLVKPYQEQELISLVNSLSDGRPNVATVITEASQ